MKYMFVFSIIKYACNGSLDRHLSSNALTWSQRIKICLDAARGLCYLHNDNGTHQRVLHRDIKSANILLDEKWNAKISDLGLSKLGPVNQQHTALVTGIVGTIGYLDPMYLEMGVLTKESDVYSFGVVLMEVLCGKLCFQRNVNNALSTLVQTWKKSCKTGKVEQIVFQDDVMQPLHPDCLRTFSKIALQCLNKYREGRPLMSVVVNELEIALKLQEPHNLKLSLPITKTDLSFAAIESLESKSNVQDLQKTSRSHFSVNKKSSIKGSQSCKSTSVGKFKEFSDNDQADCDTEIHSVTGNGNIEVNDVEPLCNSSVFPNEGERQQEAWVCCDDCNKWRRISAILAHSINLTASR
ncbi:receptor-like protein kinase HERK 1 [Rutidosis leptorrhynchoides]|uniref:receptor-like protein kinase HERK 1 n=1 Tax=Rutidosis leptorrhynchoides TaxID=125765 RepID=UPI003A99FE16